MATSGPFGPLAFVDVETTGLSPTTNRIAEIGVVTVDGDRIHQWTTFLKPPGPRESCLRDKQIRRPEDAPAFRDIAADLSQRLSGRLVVAHNARFDYAFLSAEFARVGIAFNPDVLCSVMLSRKLYPHLSHHNLDSLIECHGLRAGERHRALPDADLLWQWWQVIHRQVSASVLDGIVGGLLAGPMFPSRLNLSLIDQLPESPGAFVFHGHNDEPLTIGAAANVKLHVMNYFRVDRASSKALEYAHRVANITWRATRGMLGAQLHAASLERVLFPSAKRKRRAAFTWRFSPSVVPCVTIVPLPEWRGSPNAEWFGIFQSDRKAWQALKRLALAHRLCHSLLGLLGSEEGECLACPVDQRRFRCTRTIDRKKQLVRAFAALSPLRLSAWPHKGPIGIRERSEIHVVHHWQFLGTARNEGDVHDLLERRPEEFDKRLYLLINRTLSRLPSNKIVDLSHYERRRAVTEHVRSWG